MAGEGVGVESGVRGEEGRLLVNGGEDGLLAGEEEDEGSLVCGGEGERLLDESRENGLSDEDGVVIAVGAVVAGDPLGAVLADEADDEVPPGSGKKMAPGQ